MSNDVFDDDFDDIEWDESSADDNPVLRSHKGKI